MLREAGTYAPMFLQVLRRPDAEEPEPLSCGLVGGCQRGRDRPENGRKSGNGRALGSIP